MVLKHVGSKYSKVYDLAMRTESSSSLINSELGNMNGEKKQHSTSSQWIRKGENDGCSFPWRFGLAVSRVGQCQR